MILQLEPFGSYIELKFRRCRFGYYKDHRGCKILQFGIGHIILGK